MLLVKCECNQTSVYDCNVKNVDVTQQHSVYRSNDGRCRLWINFKVVEQQEPTYWHKIRSKEADRKYEQLISTAFSGSLITAPVEKSVCCGVGPGGVGF